MVMDSLIDGVDYGPLAMLAGKWTGRSGVDVAPAHGDGTGWPRGATPEETPFIADILFEPLGGVTNAGSQNLVAMRYHQVVRRQTTGEVFHNESGYWMWDAQREVVMQSLAIPRGVSLVAGGTAEVVEGRVTLRVRAAADDADWTVSQSPFMRDQAETLSFSHMVEADGETLIYAQTTVLQIYGERFDHTDSSTLERA